MNGNKINIYAGKAVLVVPLDWGLGHATRCIPIIKELINYGAQVIIAGEKHGAAILSEEFPQLTFINVKGYRIKYSKTRHFFSVRILLQTAKIMQAIRYENKWLRKIVELYKIDLVISDNRYGLHHKTVPCIFITHQLQILTGNKKLNRLLQKLNYAFINKYTQCWVPDIQENSGIAGKLSHPALTPIAPLKYIGLLSRFYKMNLPKKYDLLILLSGPEPQRSILENILLQDLSTTKLKTLLIRGLPGANEVMHPGFDTVEIISHLPSQELNMVIQQSDIVIARAGYSTIMDLLALGKKAVLIPTPGQKEQEYLAKYLLEKKYFYSCLQDDFNLDNALKSAFAAPEHSMNMHSLLNENVEGLGVYF